MGKYIVLLLVLHETHSVEQEYVVQIHINLKPNMLDGEI